MTVVLPECPAPRPFADVPAGTMKVSPGDAICAYPFEAEMRLDFTTPIGKWTAGSYSLFFQLPKWGFWRGKIEEWIFVSPVFREYYQLTIQQADQLEASIKGGLASIAQAISDMELVWHDLRRYKEFLDYFTQIEKGKKKIKEGKKEEGEEELKKGEQSLKSVFIDQVDVHTGEGIALKLIAPRWPTIIADFMKLADEDTDPRKIIAAFDKKFGYKISEPQAVVLATKNKLYVEWRDRLFKPTVQERYQSLMGLYESRKKSIKEYKEMLKPTLARAAMIRDALTTPETRATILKSWYRPDAQAISADFMKLWAWKPFAPSEKYKITRMNIDKIHASKAGFTPEQIAELHKELDKKDELGKVKPRDAWDEVVDALPQEPSIDKIVKALVPDVEREYKVRITAKDIYDARQMLIKQFKDSMIGMGGIEPWVFSPYFIFVSIPMLRTVLRLPSGEEIEDVQMEDFFAANQSQNFIIIHCLELIARDKQLDNHINQLLGNIGASGKDIETIEEMVKKEFPEVYGESEEQKKMQKFQKMKSTSGDIKKAFSSVKEGLGKVLDALGLDLMFLKAHGPYEFQFYHRVAKYHQPEVGHNFNVIRDFLKGKFEVPGMG
jgi:hypothetical protein